MDSVAPSSTKDILHFAEDSGGYIGHHFDIGAMSRPHRHDELEINLVTAGSATYLLQGQRYELHRHTLVWLFPAQDHILLDKSRRFDYWLGLFRPALLERTCTTPLTNGLLAQNPAGQFCTGLSEEHAARLISVFNLAGKSEETAARNAGLGFSLLTAWEAYNSCNKEPSDCGIHPAVERAVRMIRDEVDAVGLDAMASSVSLSGPHLSSLFKRQTGQTIGRFRNKQRLQRYLEIAASKPSASILEAALQAGFGSYAQFHRVFTELVGCSPAEFRRRSAP